MENETLLAIVIGVSIFLFSLVYLFYASITVKHAARFRTLSKQILYVTIAFLAVSAIAFALILAAYTAILFN